MSEADKSQDHSPTIGTDAGQVPAEGIAPSGSSTLKIMRQGILKAAKATMEFIDQSERDTKSKVRIDDRRSATLLLLSLLTLMILVTILILNATLRPLCIALGIVADILLGASILWYVLLRFGVLRKLDPRYAVLCFQLMLGTGTLFAFFAFNVVLLILTAIKMPGVSL